MPCWARNLNYLNYAVVDLGCLDYFCFLLTSNYLNNIGLDSLDVVSAASR